MTPERWARVEALLAAALERPADERAAFLEQACGDDAELRTLLGELLAEDERGGGPLDAPPLWQAAGADTAVPGAIGPYRLIRLLGRGGMGQVWLAERTTADVVQPFALKLMRRGLDTDDLLARFRTERRILARLDHPNIARLFDVGATDSGLPYLVMEFVDGEPLLDFCDRRRLTLEQRLGLFRSLCAAVHHAHRNLIVHRDIKPFNIMVTADGIPKLLDFGIARILEGDDAASTPTRTQFRLLTPEYAAPEQIRGDPVTTSCDVYALGVLLYELLAGVRPHARAGRSRAELAQSILTSAPPPPSAAWAGEPDGAAKAAAVRRLSPAQLRQRLAGDLDTVVLKALRPEPEARYPSALGLAEDIERHLTGLPVLARPATLGYRFRKFVLRNRAAVAAAAAVFLVLAGATAVTIRQSARIREQSARVARERDKALEVRSFLLEMFGAGGPDQPSGDVVTARELLDRRAALLPDEFSADPEMRAQMMIVLAEGYEKLGLYDQAEPLARGAVETHRTLFRDGHPDFVVSLNVLGWLLRVRGRMEEAEALLREAVAMGNRVFPTGDSRLARALNDLGIVRNGRGDLTEAAALLRASIAMRRRTDGPGHLGIAITKNNLAVVLYSQADLDGAVQELGDAVDILRSTLGPDHQRTTIAQTNLAAFQSAAGRHEEAIQLHRDILARRVRRFGPDHGSVAISRTMLASELLRQGEYGEAETLMVEAVRIQRAGHGATPDELSNSLRVLGDLQLRIGRSADALRSWQEGIGALREAARAETPELAILHGRTARAFEQLGQHAAADRAHETAARMSERVLGPAHQWTAEIRLEQAAYLRRVPRTAAADSVLDRLDRALAEAGIARDDPLRQRVRRARTASDTTSH